MKHIATLHKKNLLNQCRCYLVRPAFAICMLAICFTNSNAQTGYLYVHSKALSKDLAQAFNFSVTGGSTTIPSFTLEDQDVNIEPTDIGASHGTGAGELWIVSGAVLGGDGIIYHRAPNSTTWNSISGLVGSAIDGADLGHFVIVNSVGDAYMYTGSAFVQIFNHVTFGVKAMDIANNGSIHPGQGYTAIIDANGHLWSYTGNYNNKFTWADITPVNTSGKAFTRLDVNASNNSIVLTDAEGNVTIVNAAGGGRVYHARAANKPSLSGDITVDDNGMIYAISQDAQGMDAVYRNNGTTWTEEPETGLHYFLTASDAGQIWVIKGYTAIQSSSFSNVSTIYTRVGNGSGTWLDDERVQTTQNDNSIMIPVAPGTYKITEANVSNWNLQGITIYDSAAGSTQSVAGNSATIVVAAGQVAHVLFVNGLVSPSAVASGCGVNTIIQNFGANVLNPRGGTLSGLTDFHYYNNLTKNTTPDGYYSLSQNSSQWGNNNLTDHSGLSGGYFMIINASYAPNQFYKHRITGLVPHNTYVLSFWAANLSPGSPLQPNILAGITDTATGVVLGSVSTGSLATDNNWHQYTFSFVATVTTGDLFLQNNAPGGFGNDLAIDDIGFAGLCTSLPVTLIDFTAQKHNDESQLSWATTNEVNFDHFDIERSGDGSNWTSLGITPGQGNNNLMQHYAYTDPSPLNGKNYYRLKLADINGTFSYSEIKILQFDDSKWSVSMYPNPVTTGGTVKIKSNEPLSTIQVFDINGKLVMTENLSFSGAQGNSGYTINTSNIAQGMYLVQLVNNKGISNSLKLIKKN